MVGGGNEESLGELREPETGLLRRLLPLLPAPLLALALSLLGLLPWAAGLLLAALGLVVGLVIARRQAAEAAEAQRRAQRLWAAQRDGLLRQLAAAQSMLDSLPDLVFTLDPQRRIRRANRAARQRFGRDPAGRDPAASALAASALADSNLADHIRAPQLLQAVDQVLAGEREASGEFELRGERAEAFEARVRRLPEPDRDGSIAILALHDVSRVKAADRMRADFVANASHELRTPLSSLVGFIETLQGPASDDAAARERFLAIMQEQAGRMAHLIEDLLSLSRIESAEHTPPTGRVDLGALLGEVVAGLSLKARAREMSIDFKAADAPEVTGEQRELAQVFQNLIDNAIKYGRQGSPIEVAWRRLETEESRLGRPSIAVSVTDHGEGIAREHIPRLTERFYRVDAARSRQLGGTGLGLAIVKHIVSRNRGLLEVESKIGEGSTFTILLPLPGASR